MTLGWPDQGDMMREGTLPDPVTTTMMAGLRIPESINNTEAADRLGLAITGPHHALLCFDLNHFDLL